MLFVAEFLGKKLEDYVAALPVEVKIIRKKRRTGLIAARLLGVNHVKSQVITFLDSHCECADGWLEPLLARIVAKKFVFFKCDLLFLTRVKLLIFKVIDRLSVS